MTECRDPLPSDPLPGSNLKGNAAGAAWTYLLDSLELDSVMCVGRPGHAALGTLERIARHVIVADERALDEVPAGSIDLVYVTASGRRTLETYGVLTSLVGLLSHRGRLYVEDRRSGRQARLLTGADLGRVDTFWLTPARGEMRSAVPLDDEPIRRFFVAHGITVPSLHRPLRPLDRLLPMAASRNRIGLLAGRTEGDSPSATRVPAYIRDLAAAQGVDLSSYRFGLSARGRYSSRKVIFYLFAPHARRPELIIKTTRDPAHNDRLANEELALRHVARLGFVAPGTAPAVLFSGEHGGLRIVAETALDGALLSSRAYRIGARAAYTWLTELSAVSARRDATARPVIVSNLEGIEAAVERIYVLDPVDRDRLRRTTRTLVENADRLPVVFMHGDASTWNALLRADGRVAFLDWEAAELHGMPLWDLFHFARSHILSGARLRRLARRPSSLVRALHADVELRHAIEVYRHRLDIPSELVAPLLTMCWAHRALREVTRLDAGRLGQGHYLGLLRESLDPSLSAAWSSSTRTDEAIPL